MAISPPTQPQETSPPLHLLASKESAPVCSSSSRTTTFAFSSSSSPHQVSTPSATTTITSRRSKRILRRARQHHHHHRRQHSHPDQVRIPKLSTILESMASKRHRKANSTLRGSLHGDDITSQRIQRSLAKLFLHTSSSRTAVRASLDIKTPGDGNVATATAAAVVVANNAESELVVVPTDRSLADRRSGGNSGTTLPLISTSPNARQPSSGSIIPASTSSSRIPASLYPHGPPPIVQSPFRMSIFAVRSTSAVRPRSPTGERAPGRKWSQRWKRAVRRLARSIVFAPRSSSQYSSANKGKAREADVGSVVETLPGVDAEEYGAAARLTLEMRVPTPPPSPARGVAGPSRLDAPNSPISASSASVLSAPPSLGIDPSTVTLPSSIATSADLDLVRQVTRASDTKVPPQECRGSLETDETIAPTPPMPLASLPDSAGAEKIVAQNDEGITEAGDAASDSDDDDASTCPPPSPRLPLASLPNNTTPELTTAAPTAPDAPPGLKRAASTIPSPPPPRPKLAHRPSKLLAVKHSRWRGNRTLGHELGMRLYEDNCPSIDSILAHAKAIEMHWEDNHHIVDARSVEVEEWDEVDGSEYTASGNETMNGWRDYLEGQESEVDYSDLEEEVSLHAPTDDDTTGNIAIAERAQRGEASFAVVPQGQDFVHSVSPLIPTATDA